MCKLCKLCRAPVALNSPLAQQWHILNCIVLYYFDELIRGLLRFMQNDRLTKQKQTCFFLKATGINPNDTFYMCRWWICVIWKVRSCMKRPPVSRAAAWVHMERLTGIMVLQAKELTMIPHLCTTSTLALRSSLMWALTSFREIQILHG